MTISILTALLIGAAPKVGDTAPDFTVKDTEGKVYTLSEMVKSGPVIIAFFPKAFTSGCTKELKAYGSTYADLEKKGIQVLAISTDDLETQRRFRAELGVKYALVADPEGKLVSLYDVKTPVVTYAARTTFVVDKKRVVTAVQTGGEAVDPAAAVNAGVAACRG